MDIKILKNIENYKNDLLTDNLILQTVKENSEYTGIKKIKYFIFDIDNNTRKEILPQIEKYDLGSIRNVIIHSEYVYFFSCIEKEDNLQIKLMRYNYVDETSETLFKFDDDRHVYPVAKRLKVFILSDSYLVIQHEFIKTNKEENYSGFFEYKSFLYNYKDEQFYSIVDENIMANGIKDMIPMSENLCVMKTGYSLLKDNRYEKLDKDEVTVESVSIVNIGQLISDILIMQTNITLDVIDQAYYNKTIPYIEKQEDYVVYSIVDNNEHTEEIIFYNSATKETVNCINKNVLNESQLARHYVIGGEPYICLEKTTGIEFINLRKAKVEFRFDADLKLITVENNIIIFSGVSKKGIFRKETEFFEIYGYPQLNVILHEKGEFIKCISPQKEEYYIFVK